MADTRIAKLPEMPESESVGEHIRPFDEALAVIESENLTPTKLRNMLGVFEECAGSENEPKVRLAAADMWLKWNMEFAERANDRGVRAGAGLTKINAENVTIIHNLSEQLISTMSRQNKIRQDIVQRSASGPKIASNDELKG